MTFSLAVDSPAAGAARLRLRGHLDDAAAREVLHRAADVVACGCSRLVVDLQGLSSFDEDAAYAVRGCTRLARWLPEGVAVVAGSEPAERLAETAGVERCRHAPTAAAGSMVSCPAC